MKLNYVLGLEIVKHAYFEDSHVVLTAMKMLNSSLCVTDALPVTSRDIAQPALTLILSPYVLQHTQEVT